MLFALLLIVLGMAVNGVAFFGLRALAARVAKVPGLQVVLGTEERPWSGTSIGKRAVFALAGPVGCYLSAVLFIGVGLRIGGTDVTDEASMRVQVMPEGAAAKAGMVDGDRILSVDRTPVHDWPQLRVAIAKHAGVPVGIVVQRADRELSLTTTPSPTGKISVAPPSEHVSLGVGAAAVQSIIEPLRINTRTLKSLVTVLFGDEKAEIAGPVAIVRMTEQARSRSFGLALRLVGALDAYFLWIPLVLSLALFPRPRRADVGKR